LGQPAASGSRFRHLWGLRDTHSGTRLSSLRFAGTASDLLFRAVIPDREAAGCAHQDGPPPSRHKRPAAAGGTESRQRRRRITWAPSSAAPHPVGHRQLGYGNIQWRWAAIHFPHAWRSKAQHPRIQLESVVPLQWRRGRSTPARRALRRWVRSTTTGELGIGYSWPQKEFLCISSHSTRSCGGGSHADRSCSGCNGACNRRPHKGVCGGTTPKFLYEAGGVRKINDCLYSPWRQVSCCNCIAGPAGHHRWSRGSGGATCRFCASAVVRGARAAAFPPTS